MYSLFDLLAWPETSNYSYYLDDGDFVVEADVPGFSNDELQVELADNILSVSGQTEKRKINDKITIPRKYVSDEVEASVINGVLQVVFKGVSKLKEKKKTILLPK